MIRVMLVDDHALVRMGFRMLLTVARFDVATGADAYSVEVPSEGEVVWHLPEGDFVFYRWTLRALEYDAREPYPAP